MIVNNNNNDANLLTQYYFSVDSEMQTFSLELPTDSSKSMLNLTFNFSTNSLNAIFLELLIDPFSIDTDTGAVLAALILVFLNILIVSEVRNYLSNLINKQCMLAYLPYLLCRFV